MSEAEAATPQRESLAAALERARRESKSARPRGPHYAPTPMSRCADWSEREIETIRDMPDSDSAIRAYRKKFPHASRSDQGVRKKWDALNSVMPRQQHTTARYRSIWTDEEKAVLAKATTVEEGLRIYKATYPHTTRLDSDIIRRLWKIWKAQNKGQKSGALWTEPETSVIREAARADLAIRIYRQRFPYSTRTDYGILNKFERMRGSHR